MISLQAYHMDTEILWTSNLRANIRQYSGLVFKTFYLYQHAPVKVFSILGPGSLN